MQLFMMKYGIYISNGFIGSNNGILVIEANYFCIQMAAQLNLTQAWSNGEVKTLAKTPCRRSQEPRPPSFA